MGTRLDSVAKRGEYGATANHSSATEREIDEEYEEWRWFLSRRLVARLVNSWST